MRHLPTACAALLLLVSDPRALWAQPCPQNSFYVAGTGYFEEFSTAPSHVWGLMRYDHVYGSSEVLHFGSGEAGSSGGVVAQDRYRIVGPATGSPIQIQVRARFTGNANGEVVSLPNGGEVCLGSRVTLRLASGSTLDEVLVESQHGTPCAGRTIDHVLELDLQKLLGEEFTVAVSISAYSGHTILAAAHGLLSFAGMPPGYSIQSCQGYAGPPVPTLRRSWGAVKQLYR